MADHAFHYDRGGIHFPALGLWLDAPTARGPGERVLVSHAHSDHTAAHAEVILTDATGRLMQARLGGKRQAHVLEFGEPREFTGPGGSYRITLLPAGHILGSAMALVEWSGHSLLYTGDFKLAPGLAAEPCDPKPGRGCEFLVMETTFGRPHYAFPPAAEVMAGVVRFCRETLADGGVPVLLGWSLGKSQEILAGLTGTGLPVMLHPAVRRLTAVYESLGHTFPRHREFDEAAAAGHVVIGPPTLAGPGLRAAVGRVRVAALTGWACDASCRFQYRADAAFPLSDHADFRDLLELVRIVEPREVLTLHGFAAEFAATLRNRGVAARALSEPEQLDWNLGLDDAARDSAALPVARPITDQPPETAAPLIESNPGSWGSFAWVCRALLATTDHEQRLDRLATFLRELPADEVPIAADWLAGPEARLKPDRPLAGTVAAWHPVIARVTGVSRETFQQWHLQSADAAGAIATALAGRPPAGLEVASVAAALAAGGVNGTRPEPGTWSELLRRCDAEEARWLVRLALGELRLGRLNELLPEALARAWGVDPGPLQRALRLGGRPGDVAAAARSGTLDALALEPGQPVRWMHPGRVSSLEEALERLGGNRVWAGESWEGQRCHWHSRGGRLQLFGETGELLAEPHPHLHAIAGRLATDLILDGAIVGRTADGVQPVARWPAAGVTGELFGGAALAFEFVVEDVLWWNAREVWEWPWERRRSELEPVLTAIPGLRWAPGQELRDATALRSMAAAVLARGGTLTLRQPGQAYAPGETSAAWMQVGVAPSAPPPRRRRAS